MYEGKYATPIHRMNYSDGANIFFIKRDDLLPFSFGGNKVRIAEEYFRDMHAKGCDCIISYGGCRSNLNRVIANMSSSRGVRCCIVQSPEDEEIRRRSANNTLVGSLGAKIFRCARERVAETIRTAMDESIAEGYRPYYINGDIYGKGNEEVGARAYFEAYDEIAEFERSAGQRFDYIFHASGTGLTQTGLLWGKLARGGTGKIIGISVARPEETGADVIRRNLSICAGEPGGLAGHHEVFFEDGYVCGGYGMYSDDIVRVIRLILAADGIPLDTTYTGKAFWGMSEFLKRNRIGGARVLFIHTGGVPLFFDDIYYSPNWQQL